MSLKEIKGRLGRLGKRRGPCGGGVISELPGGGFCYQGRAYASIEEIPQEGQHGFLLVPGEIPPAAWNPLARAIHAAQEGLIKEGRP